MDYERFKIKTYDLWDLYLHTDQDPNLGRAYAWATRDSAKRPTDINPAEAEEFFREILPEYQKAMENLFQPRDINWACLCNTAKHLHIHMIPRQEKPITFEGIPFIDPNPEGNYAPYDKVPTPEPILLKIRNLLEAEL